MGPTFVVIPCMGCHRVATTLPLRALPDIIQHRIRSATDERFVNFVCPHCGMGSAHCVDTLKNVPAVSVQTLVRLPLYCASLQCDGQRCEFPVTVHTLARSGAQDAEP